MAKVVRFDDIEIGKRSDSYSYRLTPGKILKYLEAVEDKNPVYWDGSLVGPLVAPGTICARDMDFLPLVDWVAGGMAWTDKSSDSRRGFVQVKHEIDFVEPPRAGMKINVKGYIADKYVTKGRYWVMIEANSSDDSGKLLVNCRATFSWLTKGKKRSSEKNERNR